MEHFLVQRLVCFLWPHRHKYVAANEFMNDFTVRRQTRENHVFVLELDHHALDFPVDIPGLMEDYDWVIQKMFDCLIVVAMVETLTFIELYRHVFKWSPLCMSIFMMRFWATPNSSSFLWPSNLMTNKVTPYSGRLCHPWMNFNLDSIKDKSLTFACASRIRLTAWKCWTIQSLTQQTTSF